MPLSDKIILLLAFVAEWLYRLAVFIFRNAFYLILLLCTTVAALFGYAQTEHGKAFLKEKAIAFFAENFNGRLAFHELSFRFPNQLMVDSIKVYVAQDSVPSLSADQLAIDFAADVLYDGLLNGFVDRVHFRRIFLRNFFVRLNEDTTGNFSILNLLKSEPETSADTAESTLPKLIFDEIALDSAQIIWLRARATPATRDSIVYDYWNITNLNLLCYFEYSNDVLSLILRKLQFEEPHKHLVLRHASGFFMVTDERVEVLGLRVETAASRLACHASLSGINIFAPITQAAIEKTRFMIDLDASCIVPTEFQAIVPDVPLPAGEFGALIEARGWLNNFTLSPSYVRTPQSLLNLSGEVVGIFSLESLWINILVRDSYLSVPELSELLKLEGLRPYRGLGTIELEGRYRGTIDNFKAELAAASNAGILNANLEMSFRPGYPVRYIGDISLQRLNLATVLSDSSMQSNINFSGEVIGEGTDFLRLRDVKTRINGRFDSSSFGSRHISSATLNLNIAQQKAVGGLHIRSGEQELHFNGELDLRQKEPRYKGRAELVQVDLSQWVDDDSLTTYLNMTCELDGESFDLSKISGNFKITFDSSHVGKLYILSGTEASLSLFQSDSLSRIALESNVANFEAEGQFNLPTLLKLLSLQSAVVSEEVLKNNIFRSPAQQKRYERIMARSDKIFRDLQKSSRRKRAPDEAEEGSITDSLLALPSLQVRYKLRFKSLSDITLVLQSGYFNAIGELSGYLESQPNFCRFSANLTIDSLRFSNILAARRLNVSLDYIDNLKPDSSQARTFHHLGGTLIANVFRMKVSNQRFVKTSLVAKYSPSNLNLNLRTTNQNIRGLFDLDTDIRVINDSYVISLRDATFATQNYFWQNDSRAQILISRELIKFENFSFSNAEQEITLRGQFSLSGRSELAFTIKDFSLADIRQFLFDSPNVQLGGLLNLSVVATGNFTAPEVKLNATLDNFFYETIDIGHFELAGKYLDTEKSFTFELHANTDTARYQLLKLPLKPYTHITGEGRIPLDLSLNAEERLPKRERLFVQIVCPNISPAFLEFAAPLRNTFGEISARATLSGFFPHPKLDVLLRVKNLHTTAIASNVEYIINGSAALTPSLVSWQGVEMRDRQGGVLVTSGSVQMSDFDVQRFDIRLSFSKLLLYNKSAGRSEELLGRLVASSDELRFSGTLAEPMLSGSLRLDNGRLTQFRSGSSKGSQIVEASRFITTIVEADTSLEARLRRNPTLNLTLDEEFELSETARAIRSAYKPSFVDALSMSLRVSTVQPLVYTLVFDRFLGEQLDATIEDMAITINKRRLNYRVFGSASITSGRYNFYGVAFDIEPGATMKWFGGGLTDAVLDIFARHSLRVLSRTRNEFETIVLRPHIAGTVEDTRIEIGYFLNERFYKAPNTSLVGEEDPNAVLNFVTLLTARQWYAPPGSATSTLSSEMLTGAGLSAGAGLLSTQVTRLASAIQGVQAINIDFARDRSGQVAGVDFSFEYAVPGTDGRLVITGSGSTAAIDSLGRSSNAISNMQRLEYRISRNLVLEAFRNFGPNNFNLFNNSIAELWGIGISYRESFHTWGELGMRWSAYLDAFRRWISGSSAHKSDSAQHTDSTALPSAISRISLPNLNSALPAPSGKKLPISGTDTSSALLPIDSSAVLRRRSK